MFEYDSKETTPQFLNKTLAEYASSGWRLFVILQPSHSLICVFERERKVPEPDLGPG